MYKNHYYDHLGFIHQFTIMHSRQNFLNRPMYSPPVSTEQGVGWFSRNKPESAERQSLLIERSTCNVTSNNGTSHLFRLLDERTAEEELETMSTQNIRHCPWSVNGRRCGFNADDGLHVVGEPNPPSGPRPHRRRDTRETGGRVTPSSPTVKECSLTRNRWEIETIFTWVDTAGMSSRPLQPRGHGTASTATVRSSLGIWRYSNQQSNDTLSEGHWDNCDGSIRPPADGFCDVAGQ